MKLTASATRHFSVDYWSAMRKKREPMHPGEILREEFMVSLKLSMSRMAIDLRVPVTRIADIIHERRGITADTALRFGRYFQNTPVFWMNLQARFDLGLLKIGSRSRLRATCGPWKLQPTSHDSLPLRVHISLAFRHP